MTRKLDRRQALAAFGSVSLGALLAACDGDDETGGIEVSTAEGTTATVEPRTPAGRDAADLFDDAASCTLTPEQTEGPFYFDAESVRSDIRDGREGAPLRLAFRVRGAQSCEPIRDAVVDIWHCDAAGSYSGFDSAEGEKFCRGAQVTNADGIAQFTTIYPGWYPGRTPHVHAKVHLDRHTVLTTQAYFDDAVSDRVYTRGPYAGRGERDTDNSNDGIFDASTLLTLSREGGGYLGVISFDVEAA